MTGVCLGSAKRLSVFLDAIGEWDRWHWVWWSVETGLWHWPGQKDSQRSFVASCSRLRSCHPVIGAPTKNTSHGNEMLPQDTTHLIQRSCYQRESPCQDPAGSLTTRSLMTTLMRCKLQLYSVSHSSGLAKTVLLGTVKGGRWQGRQRKKWEDDIREWTGLEFAKSQRAVENREKWRKLVVI